MAYERNDELINTFKVPLMPILPNVSTLLNILLIAMLSPYSWLRFVGWLIVGLIIYFLYGMKNSVENPHSARICTTLDIDGELPAPDGVEDADRNSDTELLLSNVGSKYSSTSVN